MLCVVYTDCVRVCNGYERIYLFISGLFNHQLLCLVKICHSYIYNILYLRMIILFTCIYSIYLKKKGHNNKIINGII